MPWIALLCAALVGGCFFEADYAGGTYTCSDDSHKCPSGLECRLDLSPPECRMPRRDAAVDTPMNDTIDAPPSALTCVDPGILMAGVTTSGSTAGRMNLMSSFCGGGVQNARDAVYRLTTTAPNQQLTVFITGTLSAYVLNACMQTPNTAACLGSNPASDGNPISVTAAAAGPYFIVVDNLNAGFEGPYTLRVDVN